MAGLLLVTLNSPNYGLRGAPYPDPTRRLLACICSNSNDTIAMMSLLMCFCQVLQCLAWFSSHRNLRQSVRLTVVYRHSVFEIWYASSHELRRSSMASCVEETAGGQSKLSFIDLRVSTRQSRRTKALTGSFLHEPSATVFSAYNPRAVPLTPLRQPTRAPGR